MKRTRAQPFTFQVFVVYFMHGWISRFRHYCAQMMPHGKEPARSFVDRVFTRVSLRELHKKTPGDDPGVFIKA